MVTLSIFAVACYGLGCLFIVVTIVFALSASLLEDASSTREGNEVTGFSSPAMSSRGKGVPLSNALPVGVVLPDEWWSE